MRQTTPVKITSRIRAWCKQISGEEPVYLKPVKLGTPGRCFQNCLRYYAQHGGIIVPGWLIWESRLILEAEHHAVMDTGKGLLDITAPLDGEETLLFLPDRKSMPPEFRGATCMAFTNIIYPRTSSNRTPRPIIDMKPSSRLVEISISGQPDPKQIEGLFDPLPASPREK